MSPTSSPLSQRAISSYFAPKRTIDSIDLSDNNSEDGSPAKRIKSSNVTSPFFEHRSKKQFVHNASESPPKNSSEERLRKTQRWRYKGSPEIHGETKVSEDFCIVSSTRRSHLREKLRKRDMLEAKKRADNFEDTLDVTEEDSDMSLSASRTKKLHAADLSLNSKQMSGQHKKGKGKAIVIGPEGLPCTPLEESVLAFKEKYPDTVLLIEVGYRYCFYGNDAKIAGKVLGFQYGLDRNFLRTSCPVNNLTMNIEKLVAAGYKVGVVSQLETAALKKAGDNRNTLFDRKLTELYTPATFISELETMDGSAVAPNLLCIVEQESVKDKFVIIGMVSATPSTGEVVYDEFQDNVLRTELETRLAHIRPREILLPKGISIPTKKMLTHFTQHGHSGNIRIEWAKEEIDHTEAFRLICEHYEDRSDKFLAELTGLPEMVVIALALMVKYFSGFGLSNVLWELKFFSKFITHAHMLLDANTVRNLELYQNQTDFTEKGSLFWVLDRTATPFGKRLLKSWISRPLVDQVMLERRIDAVGEARTGAEGELLLLRNLLKGLPDLSRGLANIQYGKCQPKELASFLIALNRVGTTFNPYRDVENVGCTSPQWKEIIYTFPTVRKPIQDIIQNIRLERAKDNNKLELWTDPEKYPALDEAYFGMLHVESELADELKKIQKLLKMPSLKYVTVLNDEFLVEVPKTRAKDIPANWGRISSTKSVHRYRTPDIQRLLEERERYKETREVEAKKAYTAFLNEISHKHYAVLRDTINKLAIADCLLSLATLSLDGDYSRPSFVDGLSISIVEGRHPIVEQVRSDPFVPNTIQLGGNSPRNLVISGPNMGGKTCTVKIVALLVLMAQIGSYVPATEMSLSLHDAIFTRMGASDDLAAGRSTFMVELAETRDILSGATPKSLVILDELGVGTSTFDGMAIACAVLEYLCQEVKCQTLFITHYPNVARELEVRYPDAVGNRHMSFVEDTRLDGSREIRFLYRLIDGICEGSYGIECARLAGLPDFILKEATSKAETMDETMNKRITQANIKNTLRLIRTCMSSGTPDKATLEEIRANIKIMNL